MRKTDATLQDKDVEEVQQHTVLEWDHLGQRVINEAIRQWCAKPSLCACIDVVGGH